MMSFLDQLKQAVIFNLQLNIITVNFKIKKTFVKYFLIQQCKVYLSLSKTNFI